MRTNGSRSRISCGLVALSLLPLVAAAQPPGENQGDAATPPQMQQMQSQTAPTPEGSHESHH